jgi:chromosome partitioning protein
MRRICVANQKGGVAKTTTAVNLAAEIARAGKRVLLVDMDPQNSATAAIFGKPDFEYNITHVILGRVPIEQAIQRSEAFGIDVIPSDLDLCGVPLHISQQIGRERMLFSYTGKLKYDFMIIDAPPSLDLLTINAFTACDELLIPICPEYFSLKGIKLLEEIIANVRERLKSDLDILGVLITRYRERIVTGEAQAVIRSYFGDKVFKVVIPENIKVEEAHNAHLPVYKYAEKSKGAMAYRKLAKEVLNAKGKGK